MYNPDKLKIHILFRVYTNFLKKIPLTLPKKHKFSDLFLENIYFPLPLTFPGKSTFSPWRDGFNNDASK